MGGKDQASGAHRTDEVLAGLPDAQWRVLHQVRWPGRPYATVDHVVVGPGGVFVLSSECSTGAVRVSGGVLRQDGCRRDRVVAAATDAALSVREVATSGAPDGHVRTPVTPVLCFVRDERVLGLIDEVVVCSTTNLLTFLLSRPAVLDEVQVHALADRLSARLERPAERRRLDRLDRRGGLDRRARLVAPVAVLLAAALASVLVGRLDLATRIGELGTRAVDRIVMPTLAVGQTMEVPGGGVRPDLEVTVRRPMITRSAYAVPVVRRDEVLVAVPAAIRNVGSRQWVSDDSTEPLLLDGGRGVHPVDPRFAQVSAGRVLGPRTMVRPGGIVRGVWVFAVPRGTELSGVGLRVGPEAPETVRWTLGSGRVQAR